MHLWNQKQASWVDVVTPIQFVLSIDKKSAHGLVFVKDSRSIWHDFETNVNHVLLYTEIGYTNPFVWNQFYFLNLETRIESTTKS